MLAGNLGRFPATARAFIVALLLATLVVTFLHFSSYTSYEFKLSPFSPSRPVEGENCTSSLFSWRKGVRVTDTKQ